MLLVEFSLITQPSVNFEIYYRYLSTLGAVCVVVVGLTGVCFKESALDKFYISIRTIFCCCIGLCSYSFAVINYVFVVFSAQFAVTQECFFSN